MIARLIMIVTSLIRNHIISMFILMAFIIPVTCNNIFITFERYNYIFMPHSILENICMPFGILKNVSLLNLKNIFKAMKNIFHFNFHLNNIFQYI